MILKTPGLFSLSLLLFVLVPANCMAKEGLTKPQRFAFVEQEIEQHIADNKLVGAVTWISQGGEVVHLAAYGQQDRDQSVPMKTDSIFRIYSFTKSIATAAALMLWEEGKYELDDPVSKYLPQFAKQQVYDPAGNRPPLQPMTVRDLMKHTSGLISPNKNGDDVAKIWYESELRSIDISLQEFSDRVARVPLAFSPGERWQYGMSLDVLGHLIEVWSGEPFEAFLRRRIFTPLEMKDTDFFVPPAKLGRLATLYVRDKAGALQPHYGKKKLRELPFYVPTESPIRCSAGGGLFSTASDYGAFLQMVLAGGSHKGNRLLKPATVALMSSDQLPANIAAIQFGDEPRDGFKFGLGFNVITERSKWDPAARVGEFGWGGAASCHYWLWPPQDLAVITLEATWPYNRNLEVALKQQIYEAVEPSSDSP